MAAARGCSQGPQEQQSVTHGKEVNEEVSSTLDRLTIPDNT